MNNTISRRLSLLETRFPSIAPPSFSEFLETWKDADELSKSIYESALCCQQVAANIRHWDIIKSYLLRMGIEPGDNFDLVQMGKELVSDDI